MDASEVDLLESALGKTEAIVAGVRPEQSRLPTPCADYDVARLVDHVVGWATSFAARVTGVTFEGDPNDHRAGVDPAAAFHTAAETIVEAYRSRRGETEALPVGMLLMEYVGHGWDLATATGQPVTFTAQEADPARKLGEQMLKPEHRGPGKAFGFEIEAGEAAGSVERLVAFLGRSPDWRPDGSAAAQPD
jgi:uncharacterized protein (TIGR03086 family)